MCFMLRSYLMYFFDMNTHTNTQVGLLGAYKDTPEDNINALFKMALERIAFLPFGFLIDLYRYDLFSGKITEDNWNTHWEQLR